MKKILEAFLYAFITTTAVAVSFVSAQNLFDQKDIGFVGSVSVKVYCTFSPIIGGDNSACDSSIAVDDKTTVTGTTSTSGGSTTLTALKRDQVTQAINRTLSNSGNAARVVYVQGPAGPAGRDGTTTVVYETRIAGQVVSPSAYINPGSSNNPVFQTTVPGDIWQTFIHQFQFDNAWGNSLSSVNITATNTNTINLIATNFTLGTGTIGTTTINTANIQNLWANNATTLNSTSTNLFSTYASITEATTTNLYSLIANFIELFATNATITNATSSNLFATNASLTNATTTNLFAHLASVTEATTTMLFANKASITEATTTYLFAAWANFLNLFVGTLTFDSATGTNLQVANASTTNFSATGTTQLTNAFIASSTQFNSSINSGNATLTTLVVSNATNTNLFASNASLSNATTVNLFTSLASLTNATTTNLFAAWFNALNAVFTNLVATNATLTNATTTNLAVNTISNVGTNPVTFRTNGANQDFIFAPNGVEVMRISETGQEVFIAPNNDLYVGDDITGRDVFASTTVVGLATFTSATTTNLFASVARILNLFVNVLSTNIINSATLNATSSVNTLVLNASTTNATTTNTNNLLATNATLTNATITNLYSVAGDRVLGTTTMYGSLVPYASTSWMTLGTLANPWSELFVSSSSVYIGGNKISNIDGTLVWSGSKIQATGSTTEVSATNFTASTTKTDALVATVATLTNATTTNLFVSLFNAINAKIDGLVATDATITNATTTNLFSTLANFTTLMFTNLTGTNAVVANATTTNFATANLVATGTFSLATGTIASTTIVNANIANLAAANFATITKNLVENIALATTTNSLTFSTTTNILQSIVNGKISTTSLASLMGSSSASAYVAKRLVAATTTTSSTALQYPSDLTFPILSGEKWFVQVNVRYDTNDNTPGTSPDIAFALNNSGGAGATCNYGVVSSGESSATSLCVTPMIVTLSGTDNTAIITGVFTADGNGNVSLSYRRDGGNGVDSVTIKPGTSLIAYKLTGADLAEVYFAKDTTIEEGDVVALDGTGVSQVSKSSKNYQKNVLGIVSTKPGVVMGEVDGEGKAVVIGLSGRVPVKVTNKNGEVKAGDFLTASDMPGVAMKATGAGQVIGQALTDDAGTGKVMVFIKNTYHDGNSDEDTAETIADKFTSLVKNTLEKLSGVAIAMNLWVSELKANSVVANRAVVQEFCVGGECFTEADMKEFRNFLNEKKAAQAPAQTPTAPTPVENIQTPTESDIITESPTSTSATTTETVAEQVITQEPATTEEVVEATTN